MRSAAEKWLGRMGRTTHARHLHLTGHKEAILLNIINSDIVITDTSMSIPQGPRLVAAWEEYPSTDCGSSDNTKIVLILESNLKKPWVKPVCGSIPVIV